jgi:WD repeat-containing protein 23
MVTASAWSGPDHDAGTASVHSFNEGGTDEDQPAMGLLVDEELDPYMEAEEEWGR